MKLIIGIAAMLLPMLTAAQPAGVHPLSVGSRVPEIVFSNVINYKASAIKLSDFKGKLVILDFWATTCMSCVYGMPKSDSLQQRFKDSIQILLVNPAISRDSLARVQYMLQRFITQKGLVLHLPVILYDETAYTYFPFHYLPHYVWIGTDGKVKAITGAEELTAQNISAMLQQRKLCLPLKKD